MIKYVFWNFFEIESGYEVTLLFFLIGAYLHSEKFVIPLEHLTYEMRDKIKINQIEALGGQRYLIEKIIIDGLAFGVMAFFSIYFFSFPIPQDKEIFSDLPILFTGGFLVGLILALVDWWLLNRKRKKMISSAPSSI